MRVRKLIDFVVIRQPRFTLYSVLNVFLGKRSSLPHQFL